MRAYIIRRLLLVIPTVLLATIVIFLIIRLIPGDLIDIMAKEMHGYSETTRDAVAHDLGLDKPLLVQYGRWVGVVAQDDGSYSGLLQGSLGDSLWRRTPVTDLIGKAWPVTLELGLMALVTAVLIALPIGIYSALRQDSWGDYIGRSFAILGIAIPSFWLATMIIVFPSIWWGWSPPVLFIPFTKDPIGNLGMFIIPAAVLGLYFSGIIMRITRTSMLEVLRQDYIRTAWAKGLRERVVLIRHALKNALIPVVTLIGLRVAVLIGGTVIIEVIFQLPGMGRLTFDAVTNRDYTIVSGLLFVFAVVMVLTNLIVDLTYSLLDPRIRYQ